MSVERHRRYQWVPIVGESLLGWLGNLKELSVLDLLVVVVLAVLPVVSKEILATVISRLVLVGRFLCWGRILTQLLPLLVM